jgi:ribose 5-phosphate isomerase B
MTLRIALASDHGGYDMKVELADALRGAGVAVVDLGPRDAASVDYPDFAHALCAELLGGAADLGILICGTGLGMSMAANRHRGIRAALCTDPYMARMAREHNDANVLCLGGRVVGPALAWEIVRAFLDGRFAGDRHARRIAKIDPA